MLSIINSVWAQSGKNLVMKEEPVIKAFKATGAQPIELNVNISGKILDKYIEVEELQKLGDQCINEMNIIGFESNLNKRYEINKDEGDSYYNVELIKGEHMNQYIVWGKDNKERGITIILSSYRDSSTDNGRTDLVIDVVENNELEDLEDIKGKVKNIYNKFGINTNITTCITGTYSGKLNEKEKTNSIIKALQVVDGRKVEGFVEPTLLSVSAYSPMIEDYIFTGDKKMNLNVAIRYNEYEDKTYLWIGTPIIAGGY